MRNIGYLSRQIARAVLLLLFTEPKQDRDVGAREDSDVMAKETRARKRLSRGEEVVSCQVGQRKQISVSISDFSRG